MELDDLKLAWNKEETPAKTAEEIRLMLKENDHPVLKGIRKQLAIEILGWSAFLGIYYTMFDGEQKPLLINLLLIAGVLFSIVHNLMGYGMAKYLKGDRTVKKSLEYYLSKVKAYAFVSVASRVLLWAGFFLFFTYNISFTNGKYILLTLMALILLIQFIVLGRIWLQRLKRLNASMETFL